MRNPEMQPDETKCYVNASYLLTFLLELHPSAVTETQRMRNAIHGDPVLFGDSHEGSLCAAFRKVRSVWMRETERENTLTASSSDGD